MVQIYSRYKVPPQVTFDTGSESIVDKNAAYDADINNIIKRYQSVEELELATASKAVPIFGDSSMPYTVTDIFNLKQGLQNTYSSLPDDVRKQFKNYNDFITSVSAMEDDKLQEFFTNAKFVEPINESLDPSLASITANVGKQEATIAEAQP
jgi:hypothetical protein